MKNQSRQFVVIILALTTSSALSYSPHLWAASQLPRAVYSQSISAQAANVGSKLSRKIGTITVVRRNSSGSAAATSSIAITPTPLLTTSVSANSNPEYAAGGAVSQMLYWFKVVGPTAESVPIIVTATGGLSSGEPVNGAFVSVTVDSNLGTSSMIEYGCQAGGLHVVCGAYNTPIPISVMASTAADPVGNNSIALETSATIGTPDGTVTSASSMASASSIISIDPKFPHGSRFRIVVSPKVGN